jgi:hypothetical protein
VAAQLDAAQEGLSFMELVELVSFGSVPGFHDSGIEPFGFLL